MTHVLYLLLSIIIAISGDPAIAGNVCESCLPNNLGDLVHRGSSWDTMFVGHSGFKNGSIFHVTPTHAPGKALQKASLDKFIGDHSFYGAKRPRTAPLSRNINTEDWNFWVDRIVDKLEYLTRTGVDYDILHKTQKGGRNLAGFFVFDCVGFTEHMWEYFGYNPTPNIYETGLGWPLTVFEQRDSPNLLNTSMESL